MKTNDFNSVLGISDTAQDSTPLEAPSTESADGSAMGLKAVGQFHITLGWILFFVFGTTGGKMIAGENGFGVVPIVIAFVCLANGYTRGAAKKATAKAAIEASKAAERTARIEQMMVNMVNGSGQVAQPQTQAKCPKCGAAISGSVKFCPECGASTKAKCAKCGAEMASDAKFCPECGTKADKE